MGRRRTDPYESWTAGLYRHRSRWTSGPSKPPMVMTGIRRKDDHLLAPLERARDNLQRALNEDDVTRNRYCIRAALQDLVLLEDAIERGQ